MIKTKKIDLNKKADKYGNSITQIGFIVALLLVPLLNFIVFTVYVNFGGVLLSFRQMEDGVEKFVWIKNYAYFFENMKALQYDKTILISLAWLPVVGGVSLPISTIIAFFLYKKIPFSKFFVVILYIPNIIPAAVLAEFYRMMWDAGGGIVETGLLCKIFAFVSGKPLNWLVTERYANWALWIYTVWFGFGFNSLLIWGAMTRVPKEIIESAKLDGAGLFKEFFSITIPVIWQTFSMIIILTVMVPFTVYMQPLLIAANGDHGTRTIALLAMQELKRPDPYYSSAINILVACVSIPSVLITKKLTEKAFDVVEV